MSGTKAIASAVLIALSIVASLALLPLLKGHRASKALFAGGLLVGVIAALLVVFATVPA